MFIPKSSAPPPSSAAGSEKPGSLLSPEQFSQLSAYLAQYLGVFAGSSSLDATSLSAAPGPPSPWIFDSGATHHMIPNRYVLSQSSCPVMPQSIYTANGSNLPVSRTCSITCTSEPS